MDKQKESRATKIYKIAESIKNNVDNGGKMALVSYKIWHQGQKPEKKDETLKEYASVMEKFWK